MSRKPGCDFRIGAEPRDIDRTHVFGGGSCGFARDSTLGGSGKGFPDQGAESGGTGGPPGKGFIIFTELGGGKGGMGGKASSFFATPGRGVFWDVHGFVISPFTTVLKVVRAVWRENISLFFSIFSAIDGMAGRRGMSFKVSSSKSRVFSSGSLSLPLSSAKS
jgi:hypothetical protein